METSRLEQGEVALSGLIDSFLGQYERLIEKLAPVLDLQQEVSGMAVAHAAIGFLVAVGQNVVAGVAGCG